MRYTTALLIAAVLAAAGCTEDKSTKVAQTTATATAAGATTAKATAATTGAAKSEEDEIKDNLAKLSPEDRALAEKQKFCVEQTDERLGSMGVPIKLTIKGEPVFICCGGCKKSVEKDPDKALAKAKELREKNSK
jgi:hypothetical protein